MRAAVFISGVSHIVLVALALLGTPKLFDNPPLEMIEVDLVRPEEAEPPKEKPPDDKPADWKPLAEKAEPWPEAATKTQPQSPPKPPEVNQQAALGSQVPSPASVP